LSEQYHLGELKIAQDPSHPAHILPPSVPAGSRVLDVGCGAGQTLIAAYPYQLTFGIDIDLSALRLGRTLTNNIYFACSKAEILPFPSGEFDLVVARVSLVYTDLRRSLAEIRRVLKPGGLLWITLHTFAMCWEQGKASNWKGKIFFVYILFNSMLFHFTQRQISFLGRQESFQTERGMRRILQNCGFSDIAVEQGQHFLVTASAI